MPVRRAADPCSAQNVWDAIRILNSQKQMADNNRISKYLQKVLQCSQAQAELYLKQTLQDELIIAIHKVSAKGVKAGNEVESYKIPYHDQDEITHTGHDWYCIDCHLAGDVSLCVTCHRVFHAECAHKNQSLSKKNQDDNTINNGNIFDSSRSSGSIFNATTTDDLQTANCSNCTLEISDNGDDMDYDKTSVVNSSVIVNHHQNGIQSSSGVNVDDSYYDEAVCSICNMSRTDVELSVEEEELNYLLTFIYNRIKTWVPVDLSKPIEVDDEPAEWYSEKERKWRCALLFYDDINMSIVEKKLEAKEYRQPCEFKADMLSIQHNIAVYHGTDTEEYKASEFLLKDCFYEISELYNCLDCYKHSNEKIDENWFCIPCRIPHQLVWAKQLGHPYWPAKVLKETEKLCDVRFFGAKYERALLSKLYIKPITVKMTSLNIKKKPGFNRALKELHYHQKLLKDNETTSVDNKGSEESEHEDNVKNIGSSRKRKPAHRTYKSCKTRRRSSSVDNLSENDAVAKPVERKYSSTMLNITITKSRGNEYATRQTIQNLATKKRSSNPLPVVIAKRIDTSEFYPVEESSSMATNISPEELNGGDSIEIEENHEIVTSSSETVKPLEENYNCPDVDNKMPNPERQYSESVEKTRRKLEECVEKDNLIKIALECMQAEIDKISNEHDIYIKRMFETQHTQISETKKKQWCYNCEQDAIYHCCWNTAYCSLTCQQQHWQTEHKKVCRRKR